MSSNSKLKTNRDKRTTNVPPRHRWFGPGTLFALLIGAAVLATQAWNGQSGLAAGAGRIDYMAESHGQIRSAAAPAPSVSSIPVPTGPLWKPEVGWLLRQDLHLTSSQKQEILSLDRGWRTEKAGLDRELQDATAGASRVVAQRQSEHAVSWALLKTGLGEYSEISRQFDARRADYWHRGLSVLNKAQRASVDPSTPGQVLEPSPLEGKGMAAESGRAK